MKLLIILLLATYCLQVVSKSCAKDCIDKGNYFCPKEKKCCNKLKCSLTCRANLNNSKAMKYFDCPFDNKVCGKSNSRVIKGASLTTIMHLKPEKPMKAESICGYVIKFDPE